LIVRIPYCRKIIAILRYERTKNRKRAQYDAEKAALLAEDYTLGENVLTPQAADLPMAVNQ